MRKISFDFDDTLEFESVQLYAKSLMNIKNQDIEIHIVTSRYENLKSYLPVVWPNGHANLYKVAKELNIPNDRIHFTNFTNKDSFFIDKDFIWHLDDCFHECLLINRNTKTKAINSLNSDWIYKCNELLNIPNE